MFITCETFSVSVWQPQDIPNIKQRLKRDMGWPSYVDVYHQYPALLTGTRYFFCDTIIRVPHPHEPFWQPHEFFPWIKIQLQKMKLPTGTKPQGTKEALQFVQCPNCISYPWSLSAYHFSHSTEYEIGLGIQDMHPLQYYM